MKNLKWLLATIIIASMVLSACISRSSYCSCGVRGSYWTAFFRGAACFSAGFFSGLGAGGSGALMGSAGF